MAIKISLVDSRPLDTKSDALAIFTTKDFDFAKDFSDISKKLCPELERLINDRKFKGNLSNVLIAPVTKSESNCKYLILVGLGKKDNLPVENYRRALGYLVKSLPSYSVNTVVFSMPDAKLFGITEDYIAQQTSIILSMAGYAFDEYITEPERLKEVEATALVSIDSNKKDVFIKKFEEGINIAEAVNSARFWVDLPPDVLTPDDLASKAHQIAQEEGLKCEIFHKEKIKELGMGGLVAVSSGSGKESRFVIMEYKTEDKNAPTVAFVGKGITFDSGGLSLKPATSMETMKEDMSGAAAVIASMKALARLKPKINIVAITPICENLPSGTADKPGDIVRFYNGKTAEIKNTDAEGRLILADALSYAVKHYKLDAIIDLATLTGACAHALGPFFSGLFSQHEELTKRVQEAAQKSGDFVWRLPLTSDYMPAVKSDIADLQNIGKSRYMAGGTTAACFLQNFVDDIPWVHIDIAGTAFDVVPDIPYYLQGCATGVGVRLLVELAMNWKA